MATGSSMSLDGRQPRLSSGRGLRQLAERGAIAGDGAASQGRRRRDAAAPGVEPGQQEAGVERVTRARRVRRDERRRGDVEAQRLAVRADVDRRALAPPLDDGDRRQLEQRAPRTWCPSSAFASSRVANSRSGAAAVITADARAAAEGEQRRGRREVHRDERARRAAEPDRLHAGPPERLVEQRVRGQVDGVGALEPVGLEVLGAQQERGAAILDERALAVAGRRTRRSARSSRPRRAPPAPSRRRRSRPRPARDRRRRGRPRTRASSARPTGRANGPPSPPTRPPARAPGRGRRCRSSMSRSGARITSTTMSPTTTTLGPVRVASHPVIGCARAA